MNRTSYYYMSHLMSSYQAIQRNCIIWFMIRFGFECVSTSVINIVCPTGYFKNIKNEFACVLLFFLQCSRIE